MTGFGESRRRPVWKKSVSSDLLTFLQGVPSRVRAPIDSTWSFLDYAVRVTIKIVIAVCIWREFKRDMLIIEPVVVTKLYSDAGITRKVMGNRITDEFLG
jgi:hypothetical protein